jgi:hypothetical protein
MAMTGAERQAKSMAQLRAKAADADRLATQLDRMTAELERLETALAQTADSTVTARCRIHGIDLACPRCYRED